MYGGETSVDDNTAKCLFLLSQAPGSNDGRKRVFRCKTCSKEFWSFQALGGHRASHKKPGSEDHARPSKPKAATHDCSVCGLEFPIGQALGGHMRRHRISSAPRATTSSSVLSASPVAMKKSNAGISKRILCLDLNLTPMENDLKLERSTMIC